MERVEGDSLDRVLSPGGLALDTVFDIAIPIADALAAAHAKGIVHRDLKPANVMVAPDGRVKLLDFGLARPTRPVVIPDGTDTSERVTRSLDVTRPGEVMGTAPYMSPEQLQGHDVDSRSDLFSLGIVLYEMVSGARPFQGGSGAALDSSIPTETPPSLTDRRPDVPKHLGRIVQQCLEKDPESRFQTAKDVRNQLQTLRKEMEAERTASLPQQAGTSGIGTPRSSTRPVAVAVAALAVAAVSWLSWQALGGGTTAPETTPAALETTASVPKIVVLPFENLGAADDEYFADGMTDEIRSRLSRLDGLRVMSRASAVKYKGAPVPMRQLAEELGVDYVLDGIVSWQPSASGPSDVRVTAEVIQVADDTALWTASYDAVLANPFEVQSQIATQVIELLGIALVEPERAALAARPTENLEAYDLYLQGTDYLHAAREVISVGDAYFAIQLLEAAVERDPAFALAYVQLSVAHSFLWEMWEDRSDDRAALAREAVEAALVLDPALPEAHFARGLIYAAEDQRERAIEEYRTLLVRQPNNAEVYEALSKAQTELGRFEDAYASLVTAAELSPRDGRIECWAGGQMFALREFDEAIAHHRRALQLTPDRACPYVCTLDIYVNADGNTERARRFLEEIPDGVDLEARPPINYSWVMIEIIDGRYDAAIERLSLGSSQVYEFKNYYVPKDSLRAQVYGLLGRAELARQH